MCVVCETMRDMTIKMQDRWRKQCNECESKHKWCMKRLINQESKTENFPDSIGRTSIERGKEFRTQKLTGSIGLTKYKSSF